MSEGGVAVNNVGAGKVAGTTGEPPVGRHSKKPEMVRRKKMKRFSLWLNERTDTNHRDALLTYTGDSYPLNKQLWQGHFDHPAYERQTHAIDAAIGNRRMAKDTVVYSGMPKAPAKEGHEHKAFLSTSLNKDVARRFTKEDEDGYRHIIKLHLKKGQRGVHMRHFAHYSKANEDEVLLPRGLKLRHRKEATEEVHDGKKYRIHHMEVENG